MPPVRLPRSHYHHGEGLLCVPRAGGPEILVMSVTLPVRAAERGAAPDPAYVLTPCRMRPRSRGRVRLASADPRDPPLIDPAFVIEDHDVDVMADAISIARERRAAREMADWRRCEGHPGPALCSRQALRAFGRRAANSFHHPEGTCRMGVGAEAVVDVALRVRGVQGWRVVDASVMPSLPQAMVNAATIAIAEQASDRIRAG